jgi:hypothetical protein
VSLLYGLKAIHQSAAANRPHVLGFNTARSVANDTLFELWNAATVAGIKAAVDLDGKFYSAAIQAGGLLYGVTGGIANVRRLDALAIGTANQVLRVNAGATAPEWASTLSGLTLTTPTINGAALSGTLTGTPTWGSSQAITLSTAAQPNVTSLGTLTGLSTTGAINLVSSAVVRHLIQISGGGGLQVSPTADALDTNFYWLNSLSAVKASLDMASGAFETAGLVTASAGVTVLSGGTERFKVTESGGNAAVTVGVSGGNALYLTCDNGTGNPSISLVGSGSLINVTVPLVTIASASGIAGFRVPHGAAPSSPVNGDLWTTTAGLFVQIDGVTKTVTLT